MMPNLLDLPAEVLVIIMRQLDIKSVYNLYKTCEILKNVSVMQGVVRVCNLSCSTLATPKSLQLHLIKQISENLHELNMCGVYNLSKIELLPAIRNMKCLKTLDVSYTKINVFDMLDIYKNCPTIRNLSINYDGVCVLKLPDKTLHEYQEVFKNFVNIHFVITTTISVLPLNILHKCALNTLKFTSPHTYTPIIGCKTTETMCAFTHLCIFIVNRIDNVYLLHLKSFKQFLPHIQLENYEFIIIENNPQFAISTSPLFKKFFMESFNICSLDGYDVNTKMYGISAIFIWNKEVTIFDELFYVDLKKRLKKILTCNLHNYQSMLVKETLCYDMFYTYEFANDTSGNSENREPDFKTRRIDTRKPTLDYDKIFIDHNNVMLSVYICDSLSGMVSLSSSNQYLSKLTMLSLFGLIECYSNDFFNILFRCCTKLLTLNIEAKASCCSSLMRSIPLSQSLKNIRLVDKRIDFTMLFSSFSQCKTLENIYVVDKSNECNKLADPIALYRCVNLYNLNIQACITNSTIGDINRKMAVLEKSFEHYIHCVLHKPSIKSSPYDPYIDVFNLKIIKPV